MDATLDRTDRQFKRLTEKRDHRYAFTPAEARGDQLHRVGAQIAAEHRSVHHPIRPPPDRAGASPARR